MTDLGSYVARINRVIDHIDAHLAERLDLATLAQLAHVSAFHFHRIFQAMTGETPGVRVRRRRVEAAAQRLLASPPASILQIALEVGFGSPEVFTRAFKAHFGMTPTAWREGGSRRWAEQRQREQSKIHQEVRKNHQDPGAALRQDPGMWRRPDSEPLRVELRSLGDARVAYLRYVGPYGSPEIGRTWQRLLSWCNARDLVAASTRVIGVSRDSPVLTPPELLRYDACVEIAADQAPEGRELSVQQLAGGRYACARFTGTAATIHTRWMRLYSEWLPSSPYQADDRPGLELYDLPLQSDTFSCLLCLPVRPS
jgi:AraC family transcriptional regulator